MITNEGTRFVRKIHPMSPHKLASCVKCGDNVSPGLCYTGSVITGQTFRKMAGVVRTPITVSNGSVFGGILTDTTRNVGFFTRIKGYLCDECAADYSTVTDYRGNRHEVVKTDPRPGFIGSTIVPEFEKITAKPEEELSPRNYHRSAGNRVNVEDKMISRIDRNRS